MGSGRGCVFQWFFGHSTWGVSCFFFFKLYQPWLEYFFNLRQELYQLECFRLWVTYTSIKIVQTIRKFMGLLNKRSGAEMKPSRTQVFPSSFCWDILGVLAFTFRTFRGKKEKQYFFFFLAVPCGLWDLSSPTRDQTPAVEIGGVLTTGLPGKSQYMYLFNWRERKTFPRDFYLQNTFRSNTLARIGSHARALAQREAGMQISDVFTLPGRRQVL